MKIIFKVALIASINLLAFIGCAGMTSHNKMVQFENGDAYRPFDTASKSRRGILANDKYVGIIKWGIPPEMKIYSAENLGYIETIKGYSSYKTAKEKYDLMPETPYSSGEKKVEHAFADGMLTLRCPGEEERHTLKYPLKTHKAFVAEVTRVEGDMLAIIVIQNESPPRCALMLYDLKNKAADPRIIEEQTLPFNDEKISTKIKREAMRAIFNTNCIDREWLNKLAVVYISGKIYLGRTSTLLGCNKDGCNDYAIESELIMYDLKGKKLTTWRAKDLDNFVSYGNILVHNERLTASKKSSANTKANGAVKYRSHDYFIDTETGVASKIPDTNFLVGFNRYNLFYSNDTGKTFFVK